MNFCHNGHKPLYKIKYKSDNLDIFFDEWFVCDQCFGKPDFFGASGEIESIIPIDSYLEMILEIDNLSKMTNAVTAKFQKILVN